MVFLVIVFGGMLASVNQNVIRRAAGRSAARRCAAAVARAPRANFALLLVLGLTLPSPFVAALEQVLKVLGV